MEFSRARPRRQRCSPLAEVYPFPIQFYEQPPTENVSLQDFENFAVERLKLLKCIETLGVSYVRASESYNKKLEAEFRKLRFPYRVSSEEKLDEYEIRRKDHISHFILRLAYCQSEDLRRWFIQQELEVFRFRFNELHNKQLEFLKHNKLEYQAIETKEKEDVKMKLAASGGHSSVKIDEWLFYKVPFTDALELVRVRKVFVKNGFAYIPHPEIVIIVLNEFRQRLSKSLAIASRSLPVVQSDERLQPLLNHLSHAYVGQNYSIQKNVGKISLEQIDSFDKLYAYNIRHSFGKEGKRTDYTPFSCMKIILSNPPSQGDYHGCPFRHSDLELLKQKLQTYKIPPAGIAQILDLVKGMHYQLACQKYFELTHNIDEVGFSLTHPNQYFNESQKLLNSSRDIKRESSQQDNSQWNQGSQATRGVSTSASKPMSQVLSSDMDGLEELLSEGYM
ncbi:DNA primase large subunit [Chiloscyllium plagiosum]|uniref:DNA primase large subunit n=1 Tax=Chiloscyllium plagiosum TaxID=36176 RepID=UPI001CB7F128|nr:DNA primase large subunit [Chiloscyllium plagiosum]